MDSEKEASRFWSRVEKTKTCWMWKGARTTCGYGRLVPGIGGTIVAHRISLALAGVPTPKELLADHICRNRACVNPAHLRMVTREVNSIENSVGLGAVNAAKKLCPRGHEYEPTTWIRREKRRPRRVCRICKRIMGAARHKAKQDLKGRLPQARGERCRHKVKEQDVIKIRKLWALGKLSQPEIAKLFGVHQANVSAIVNRKTWKHLK